MIRKTAVFSAFAVCAFLAGEACTAVYVGKKVSADGATYLARTEDDWGMDFWHFASLVPARDGGEKAWCRGAFGFARELPARTYRYFCFPRATQFGTGRLSAEAVNEKGLAITGAVTAWAKKELLALDPLVPDGSSWETMPDYLGATCATAREAVETFGRVIDEQGSFEGAIYMFADRREAWYFETYTGHHWAALRMPDDRVATFGNEFMLGEVDPASEGFRCSKGLFDLIGKAGCAVRGPSGRIHLAASCAAPQVDFCHMRTWYGHRVFAPSKTADYRTHHREELFFVPDAKVAPQNVFRFVRSHFEGTPFCPETSGLSDVRFVGGECQEQVHLLAVRDDLPAEFSVVSWSLLGPAEHSAFVPVPAVISAFEPDWACDSPPGAKRDDRDTKSAAHRVRKLATLARVDRERYGRPIRAYWERLENRYLAEWPKVLERALACGDRAQAVGILSDYSRACQREFSEKTADLTDQLLNYMVTDVRTVRWHITPDGYGVVPIPENKPFDPK